MSAAPAWSAANATRIGPSARPAGQRAGSASPPWPSFGPCRWRPGGLVAGVDGRDAAAEAVADDPPGDLGDALRGEAEVLEDRRPGGARPEVVDPDDRALVADLALPAERDPGLDAQPLPDPRREDLVAVGGLLEVEQLPARERHDPRPDALGGERIGGRDGQRQLRARREEDQLDRLGAAARLADDVAAAGDAVAGPRGGLGQRRQLLAGQREGDRAVRPRRPPRAQAADVSFASPGRTNHRFGIARSAA